MATTHGRQPSRDTKSTMKTDHHKMMQNKDSDKMKKDESEKMDKRKMSMKKDQKNNKVN